MILLITPLIKKRISSVLYTFVITTSVKNIQQGALGAACVCIAYSYTLTLTLNPNPNLTLIPNIKP